MKNNQLIPVSTYFCKTVGSPASIHFKRTQGKEIIKEGFRAFLLWEKGSEGRGGLRPRSRKGKEGYGEARPAECWSSCGPSSFSPPPSAPVEAAVWAQGVTWVRVPQPDDPAHKVVSSKLILDLIGGEDDPELQEVPPGAPARSVLHDVVRISRWVMEYGRNQGGGGPALAAGQRSGPPLRFP